MSDQVHCWAEILIRSDPGDSVSRFGNKNVPGDEEVTNYLRVKVELERMSGKRKSVEKNSRVTPFVSPCSLQQQKRRRRQR